MSADSTLNRFLSQGTAAQRVAFTPTPPTPATGPAFGYFWFETDTGLLWAWNTGATAWDLVSATGPTYAVTTTVALTALQLVSFGASGLVLANATDNTKPARGFVMSPYSSSASARVFLIGSVITGLTVTAGAEYYLDTTGGAITSTPPAAAGNLVQSVGAAPDATSLVFMPTQGITL